ncbi:Dephospho-CoA kinase [Coemansia sp. Benny D115]|nr:Dephospho-CoA kinase [Coemansia sp. Benny D115]
MLIVGLTGGIATGKSTASLALSERSIPIIDADRIAHELMQPGETSFRLVVKHFGTDVLDSDGKIDRGKLGGIIFNDAAKRQLLNRCTHPYVRRRMLWELLRHYVSGHRVCILDVPLLYEAGMDKLCGRVLVIGCSRQTQVARLMGRNGFTRAEAEARVDAQMSLDEKRARADAVVDNEQDMQGMQREVCRVVGGWTPGLLATMGALVAPVAAAVAVPWAFTKSALWGVGALCTCTAYAMSTSVFRKMRKARPKTS